MMLSDKFLNIMVGLLLMAMPALALVQPYGANVPYVLLVLLAVFVLPRCAGRLTLQGHEKWLLWAFAVYFLWTLLSWALADFNHDGIKHVGRAARFVFFIPAYFLLRRLAPSVSWLFHGLAAGAIGAGLWALTDVLWQFDYSHGSRVSGTTHPILFGNLALLMGLMSLCFWQRERPLVDKALIVLAAGLGLTASLLSASRGGWIALPLIAVFLLWQVWRHVAPGMKVFMVAVIVVLPVVLYLIPQTTVQSRIQQAVQDVQRYQQGDSLHNSLGERFAMWQAAWRVFQDKPLLGEGVGRFIDRAHQLRDSGQVPAFQDDHYHAHNVYVTVAAQSGLVGLASLLAVFLYPLYRFSHYLRDADMDKRSLARAGVVLVLGYMHFGLSEAIFQRSLPILFYVFHVLVIMALLNNAGNSQLRR